MDSIFENCSLLAYIPNISKWKINNNIKINYIFKGCNSLLIPPDISKWNINFPENSGISSSNCNYNKEIKSNSISSEHLKYFNNLFEDISSLKSNNDNTLLENYISEEYQKNEEYNDYYDNFYS